MEKKNYQVSEGATVAMQALDYLRKATEAAKRAISLMYDRSPEDRDREIGEYEEKAEALELYLGELAADFVNGDREEVRNLILSK